MSRFIAIDWDHNLLQVASGNLGRGSVQIQRAAVFSLEQNPGATHVDVLGQILKQRLKEAGIAPAPVLVSIGRDRFIFKDVRFPMVPENEETAVVRFQATKDLTDAPEDTIIDYQTMGEPGPSGEKRAWVVVLKKQLLSCYQQLCKSAGLKLEAVTPRVIGTAICAQKAGGALPLTPGPETSDGAVAVLTVTSTWAEFCVVRGGQALFNRSIQNGPQLIGEIRRNLALYAGQPQLVFPRDRVQALYVAGNGEHAILREQLQELLAIPVHPLDPFAGLERLELNGDRGGFTGAVGLLLAKAEPTAWSINFAKPKEAKPTRNPRRERNLMYAAVGLVALVALFLFGRQVLALKRDDIDRLQAESQALDGQLAVLKKDSDRLKELQGWTGKAVSWIDEMADLSYRFGETKHMQATEVTGSVAPVNLTGKKYDAQIVISGEFTGDEREITKFVERLSQSTMTTHHRVAGKTIMPSSDGKKPSKFSVKIEIEKIKPVKKTAKKTTQIAGRKS